MRLFLADWLVILGYFALSLLIGLYYSGRAGRNINEYFLSDRSLPWWLAGTSMVATTFAADTPLAVTGMVARYGIAGNWLWWNFVLSGMLTVFFFARLWRRAGVMTDVELAELRYAGKPAAFLRAFRALYLAIPINCIIMGWVTLGMAKVMDLTLGVSKWQAVIICFVITAFYSTLSGLWGVVVTDFFQFAVAMFGSIALAHFALDAVGGISALKARIESESAFGSSALSFVPDVGSEWMPLLTFLVYISVNWWAAWYPGAEPGGGGYIAQRIFSARDEKHSLLATLWFNIAHYALRPWPWILVALSSMVLYPGLSDPESGYVKVMVEHLPPIFRGLLLAAFAAAYMSTIATQLNWGASYIVNDFYRRFIKPEADERHYVLVARLATVAVMLASGVVTYYMSSIEGAWKFLIALGAGTGAVLILRWYWWRINAWSEITAMIASFIVSIGLQVLWGLDFNRPLDFAKIMLITVSISTAAWLVVTLMTEPEPEEKLIAFYSKVRPGAALWKPIAAKVPEAKDDNIGLYDLVDWAVGCLMIYMALFGIGKLVLGTKSSGIIYLAVALAAGWLIFWDLKRRGWKTLAG